MSGWERLDAIAAELGSLMTENDRFRRKIDLLWDEAKLLKQQATNAGTNFEVLRQDAKKLIEELRESFSTSAELRANAAQLRADAAQVRQWQQG